MALTSTWGFPGTVAHSSLTRELVFAARDWLDGKICLDEVRAVESCLPQRRNLAIVVNNECNLKCSHCFLQIPRLGGTRLNHEEWQRVLASAVREDIGQYLIVGKEVFVGQTGPKVVSILGGIRSQRPYVRTGLITNGTLLHEHFGLIERAALSHIDLSMEGDATDHDAIRGTGAFSAVRPNVAWAARLLGERLFVTLTLQKRNIQRLEKALAAFSEMGVKSVGVSPFEPLPYTDTSLALSSGDYRWFFENLNRLEDLSLPHDMFVQIDTCAICPDMLVHFIESDWFSLDSMELDGTGFLYAKHRLENGITLSFRFLPWPLSVDFHTRISADGEIVCAADGYSARGYSVNRLANVRDFDFDFGAAFMAACKHPRLAYLDAKFEADVAPRVRAAYRGHRQGSLKVVPTAEDLAIALK